MIRQTTTRRACGRCAYYAHSSDESGECRRYPPSAGWPRVTADAWCGEYRPSVTLDDVRRMAPRDSWGQPA